VPFPRTRAAQNFLYSDNEILLRPVDYPAGRIAAAGARNDRADRDFDWRERVFNLQVDCGGEKTANDGEQISLPSIPAWLPC
jgi:hypothetical protein